MRLNEIINKIKERIRLLRKFGFKPAFLFTPVIFSLMATFSEGLTVVALIPLVKGIIIRDFKFIQDYGVFRKIADLLPASLEATNLNLFIFLLLVVFISGIMKNVFSYLSSTTVSLQIRRAAANLRYTIFERYLKFGKLFFDRSSVGQLQNILTNFSSTIGQEFSNLNTSISHFLLLLLYITIMFFISVKLTLLVLLILPLFDLVFRGLIKKIKQSSRLSANSSNILARNLSNVLSCMTLVKLYNNEEVEKKKFQENNNHLRRLEFSIDRKYNLIPSIQEGMFLGAVLVLVAFMSYMYVREKTGELSSFMVYFYLLRKSQQGVGCFNRIKMTLARIGGPLLSVTEILDDKEKFIIKQGNTVIEEFRKQIEIRNLNFAYPNNKKVLSDVSLTIQKGMVTAIVGSSGAGKTTLASLLLRFYDCPAGTIFIDGTDIREFSTASLYRHFSYVSQDTLIFSDTIRNNIIYGVNRLVRDEEILEVAKKARLFDFIVNLPKGLDTNVGDRGVRLSGGEKQRLSIARALFKGSEILILDEATSSLDSITEKLIQEAIDEAIKGRTVIVIAHRLATIKNADKIIVMESGRVVEEGTLEQLINQKGKFCGYWQEQRFF